MYPISHCSLVLLIQESDFYLLWYKIHEDLDSGKPSTRLLYVTPELIATPGFMSKLTKIYTRGLLTLIAIDEVCAGKAISNFLSAGIYLLS